MDRQQVLEALYAAFPEQPIVAGEIDFDAMHPNDQERARTFLHELAGKRWRELTPAFCEEWRFYFGYLQPEAYCYYMPAMPATALSAEPAEKDPMHSVVFAINPSFELVARDGVDAYLLNHQEAFHEAQYRAVCAFLGLAVEMGERFNRFQAVQGLRWGWNRYPTAALEAANAYFQQMSTFVYPESADPQRADLCREIREAFAATPYPGDAELYVPGGGEEPGEIAMGLRGVSWQSAHPHLLDACPSALSFLSDAGFRYFLPSYLTADLLQEELSAQWDYYGNASPVFHLTHGLYDEAADPNRTSPVNIIEQTQNGTVNPWAEYGLTDEVVWSMVESAKQMGEIKQSMVAQGFNLEAYRTERFAVFTPAERRAIIHYLEFQAQDEFSAFAIEQALTNYWRPSLEASEAGSNI